MTLPFDVKQVIIGLDLATTEDIEFLQYIAGMEFENKNYAYSYKFCDKIIKLNRENIDAWHMMGMSLVDLGRYEEALHCFDSILEIDRDHETTWLNKGATLGTLGRYEESIYCLEKALKLNKRNILGWVNKGTTLDRLKRYDDAIECFDKAILLDPTHLETKFNKGTALLHLKRYREAIEAFNEALKLDPNYQQAWTNKGLAFGELGEYEDEIKCCDSALDRNPCNIIALNNKGLALSNLKQYKEALVYFEKVIDINPNFIKSIYNKGLILQTIKKYRDAKECYDKVLELNPRLPEAYGNRGILSLEIHDYDKAEEYLTKAKVLFTEIGKEDCARVAAEQIQAVKNVKALIPRFDSIDNALLECLKSGSLYELRNKITDVLNSYKDLLEGFDESLPENVIELLSSKEICISSLFASVNFNEVDFQSLNEARKVFFNINNEEYLIVLNSIENFCIRMNNYHNIGEIPRDIESGLLITLRSLDALGGKLTVDIFRKFELKHYESEKAYVEKSPEVNYVTIPEVFSNKNFLRLCLVQLDYTLTKKFPYELDDKNATKIKIFKALEIANRENVDIVSFPELSGSREFIPDAKNYKDMIIILGSYYYNDFNICPVIISGEEYLVYKLHPSPYHEQELIAGRYMKPGNDIKIFTSSDNRFRFVVLICIDYIEEHKRFVPLSKDENNINLIINPSLNPDIHEFQNLASSNSKFYHIDWMATNIKKHDGKDYGGTCFIGVENKTAIDILIKEGCRQKDSISYKLCEANGEMLLILDIFFTNVETPTRVRATPRIKILSGYEFKDDMWQEKALPWWEEA